MISNASPIIFLAKTNQLSLLKQLFNKIYIPASVKEEILTEEKAGFMVINSAIKEDWIKVIESKKGIELGFALGKGEQDAINLAMERKEPLIIDDAVGVKIAKSFNIDIYRTTTLILMAVKKKILTKKEAINLINKLLDVGYYIAPKHYAALIEKLND